MGAGAFKYKACDFCDVFAETADFVVGDACLPEYIDDSYGTNVVISRNPEINEIVVGAIRESRLHMDKIDIKEAVSLQDAGLRHRRQAISYRLYQEKKKSNWVPVKRMTSAEKLKPRYEQTKQDLRIELRIMSHESFLSARKSGDIRLYMEKILPLYRRYKRVSNRLVKRIIRKAKSLAKKALTRFL